MTDIKTLQNAIYQNAVDHGFWSASDDIPTKLMLMVTEVAEAMEDYRSGRMDIEIQPWPPHSEAWVADKPEGFPVELADVVIRVFDLAAHLGIDLGAVIELKMAFNATRPALHGGKRV